MAPREIRIGSGLSIEKFREARARVEKVERKVRSAGQTAIGVASEILPASLSGSGRIAREVSSFVARREFPITPEVGSPQEASRVLDFPAPTSPDSLGTDITLVDAA